MLLLRALMTRRANLFLLFVYETKRDVDTLFFPLRTRNAFDDGTEKFFFMFMGMGSHGGRPVFGACLLQRKKGKGTDDTRLSCPVFRPLRWWGGLTAYLVEAVVISIESNAKFMT